MSSTFFFQKGKEVYILLILNIDETNIHFTLTYDIYIKLNTLYPYTKYKHYKSKYIIYL
jgi:hypothetical protein